MVGPRLSNIAPKIIAAVVGVGVLVSDSTDPGFESLTFGADSNVLATELTGWFCNNVRDLML